MKFLVPDRFDSAVVALTRWMTTTFGHDYLSTSCLHEQHAYCRSATNIDGEPKTPGTCKFCPAVCLCDCHKIP